MTNTSLTLGEVADRLGLECRGDRTRPLVGLATLVTATANHLSFFANAKYRKFLHETHAGAVIVAPALADECPVDTLVAADPYRAYAQASQLFDATPRVPVGIHPTAVVAGSAQIDTTAAIAAYCVIGERVVIGARVSIGAGTVISDDCVIGDDSTLSANVTLQHRVIVGSGCEIHSGAVIGGNGFGFAPITSGSQKGQWEKIAQLGTVRIGRNVRIGANSTVDRGAIDDTVIADHVIIDNLVHIAHNVQIGEGTAIAGCTGVAGSTTIGAHVAIGGQCGIAGHITIADGAQFMGQARINGSVEKAGVYASGTGLADVREWRRNAVRFTQLDELYRRVVELEKKVELEKQLKKTSGGEAE